MVEEDALLDEQIRKKKRFVLLALFTLLLLGTLAALPLIAPAAPSPETVAEAEVKTPAAEQPTSIPLDAPTRLPPATSSAHPTLEPTPQPATTVSASAKTPSGTAEATSASSGTPVTAEASPAEIQGDEWQEPATPLSNKVDDTPIAAINPKVTLPAEGESAGESSTSSTPAGEETSETGIEPPLSISDLPRVHEIWEPTEGAETLSSVEASATNSLTPTASLTNTSTMSETEVMIPPDGLPVTGISLRPGLNWAAVVIVILLLGAGTTALYHPGSRCR